MTANSYRQHWQRFSLLDQMGNIGSEVGRAIMYRQRHELERSQQALYRALELFDFTLTDRRWRGPKLREIARAREVTCDFLAGDNQYGSTPESLENYFMQFAIAARANR